MADDPNAWTLTTTDVAAQLGVHPDTVVRWANAHRINCFRLPGGVRKFRQSDVDDFILLGQSS
jgi:excisionase family DNA binding protein